MLPEFSTNTLITGFCLVMVAEVSLSVGSCVDGVSMPRGGREVQEKKTIQIISVAIMALPFKKESVLIVFICYRRFNL
jgi:hypothetical protein